jgi:hypothetical protein
MFHSRDFHEQTFNRLHHLKALFCNGAFPSGSPEHAEILALEELGSFFVRQYMRDLHEARMKLSERIGQSMVSDDF